LPTFFSRILGFLRSHPILCLFFLTPGIIEYVSGSSPIANLVLSPPAFIIGLLINAALYLPGALLIREAAIRWKKGWASVLLLGAAYGVLEEGIALSTLFNTNPPIPNPGYWHGVNWVYAAFVVPYHAVFSIALPLLLLQLALPSTKGRRLLNSKRAVAGTFAVLGIDVYLNLLIAAHVEHFWMGWTALIASIVIIAALVVLAYKAPTNFMRPKNENPTAKPLVVGAFGALAYLMLALILVFGNNLPSSVDLFLTIIILLSFLVYILKAIGKGNNEKQLIALSFGIILPFLAGGIAGQIELPLVLILDFALILFFRRLWQKYSKGSMGHNNEIKTEET
jgi:hypothetical protein